MLKQNEISIELQGQAGKQTQDKGAARILKSYNLCSFRHIHTDLARGSSDSFRICTPQGNKHSRWHLDRGGRTTIIGHQSVKILQISKIELVGQRQEENEPIDCTILKSTNSEI